MPSGIRPVLDVLRHLRVVSAQDLAGNLVAKQFLTKQCPSLGTIAIPPGWLIWLVREERAILSAAIANTPSVWVGEVSWLKADLLKDVDRFVPGPIQHMFDAVKTFTIITDEVIEKVSIAFDVPNTTDYSINTKDEVVDFLKQHKNRDCFVVYW